MRVFIPVLVRGEEHLGVRLWEFGKEIYQQLLGIASDEDYGDYTDITDGRDFTVEATEAEAMGKKITKCALRIKQKTSPLSENSVDVEKFLNDQPDILSLYKKHSFEDLKNILQKWLNPEEEIEDIAPVVTSSDDEDEDTEKTPANDLPWEEPQPAKTYTPEPKAAKKSSADKFNALFEN